MSEHFVKYINIEKYKCFEDFSAEGFKRVNLISGKNNVGKTALMEALDINVSAESVQFVLAWLYIVQRRRQKVDEVFESIDKEKAFKWVLNQAGSVAIESNIHSLSFEYDDSGVTKIYKITVNGHDLPISEKEMDISSIIKNISEPNRIACYVSSLGDSQKDIIMSFSAIQVKDQEIEVNKQIKHFDNSIENVKIIGDSIQCKVMQGGEFVYRSISEFGDGLRHFLAIIADIFMSENGYLFIDELDNGVHYSSLDQLWEIILNLSKELNVQVFATTHSRECIESYCRVAEKLKEKDISFITLVRNKEKAVKAIVRDYEVFTDSIHDNREVRGW